MLVKVNSYAAYSHNYSRYSFTRFFISIKIKSHVASLESQTKGFFITKSEQKSLLKFARYLCWVVIYRNRKFFKIHFIFNKADQTCLAIKTCDTVHFYVKSVKTSFILPVLRWLIKSYRISKVKKSMVVLTLGFSSKDSP